MSLPASRGLRRDLNAHLFRSKHTLEFERRGQHFLASPLSASSVGVGATPSEREERVHLPTTHLSTSLQGSIECPIATTSNRKKRTRCCRLPQTIHNGPTRNIASSTNYILLPRIWGRVNHSRCVPSRNFGRVVDDDLFRHRGGEVEEEEVKTPGRWWEGRSNDSLSMV